MTAQDAFAIAFDDEVVAMDAMPGNDMPKNSLPQKPSAPSGLKKNAAMMPGAKASGSRGMDSEMSIAEHMARYHPDGFDPKVNKCSLFDSMVSSLEAQGLDPAEAQRRALIAHGQSATAVQQQPQQQAPQEPNPALQEQAVQQLAQNPQAIETAQSQMLAQPEELDTSAGEIPVQTTIQKAIVENLENAAATGDPHAKEALEELKDKVDDGEITPSTEQPVSGQESKPLTEEEQRKVGYFKAGLEHNNGEMRINNKEDIEFVKAHFPEVEIEEDKYGGVARVKKGNETAQPAQPKRPKYNVKNTAAYKVLEKKQGVLQLLYEALKDGNGQAILAKEDAEVLQKIVDVDILKDRNGLVKVKAKSGYEEGLKNELAKVEQLLVNLTGTPARDEPGQQPAEQSEEKDVSGEAKKEFTPSDGSLNTNKGQLNTEQSQQPSTTQPRLISARDKHEFNIFKPFTSTDGTFSIMPDRESHDIMSEDPSKKEIYQKMVDNQAAFQNSKDEAEKKDLDDSLRILKRMFYGPKRPPPVDNTPSDDGGKIEESTEESKNDTGEESATPPSPPPEKEGGGNGGSKPPQEPPIDEGEDERFDNEAPDDEQFRVGKNKYKVGGMVYRDVSGMGPLRGALASLLAGISGEGIITGWDRLTGTWDEMKRSEAGEKVRDGILGAFLQDKIDAAASMEGLSENALIDIKNIQDLWNSAKTPEKQSRVAEKFKKWKEQYAQELDAMDTPKPGETFKPLASVYKGKKPPLSILKKSEGFEADKEFGDKVAKGLQERLGILGFQIDNLVGVSVGPSATTVKFKIPPTFDMTAANSKKTREALKGAIGTDISNVEYAKGEKDVMAITVTNPEMRNVSFSDVMNSQKWKTFAQKAALPIPVGRDSSGEETMLDAATMPQTIVTGATGSGKSIFISAAINGIEMEKTPDEARIVLLDPKNEFKVQDGSPHLLFPRAGGDPDKAKASKDMADVLDSLVAIMNDRVTKIGGVIEGFDPQKNEFKGAAEHSIKQYNETHPEDKMPHVLLVFDEIANARDNASAADKARIDLALQKITAIGRSVGVNCLLATQRDDVGSIPGIIQANCPGRVTFKASPTDAKASPEAKALAGNGDYILTDKAGNKTRGRGCFISPEEEMAIPSYYRDHMEGGDDMPEPELPKEYKDGIAEAVRKGANVSVEAIEGLQDAFKAALPKGWTVSEEVVDGNKHWKATPPKPTRVDMKDAKKLDADKPKGISLKSREDALESIKAIKEAAIAKADADYEKDGDLGKYEKALQKAGQEEQRHMSIVNTRFPEKIADGDNLETGGEQEATVEPKDESNNDDEDEDTPQKLIERAKNRLKTEREKINKSRDAGKISEREAIKRKGELSKRFKAAEAKFKAGGSVEDILNELEPEEKLEKPAGATTSETPKAESGTDNTDAKIDAEAKAAQEEEAKNEKLRNSVPPQKGYSDKTIAGSFEATERLTPKDQKNLQERYLPDGWGFVTDNTFKAPAKNKFGVVFVRDPKTGSQGRLIPDPNNPKGFKFQKDIDTTHPEFKGYVKKADGTWELSPEAKKVEEETRLDRKQSRDAKKREEALKRFNRARFGHDEAPDNATIVANAVAKALDLIK